MPSILPSARDVAHKFYQAYLGGWYTLSSRHPLGTNIFDEEWDLLVVLDACRVDAIREVAPEYGFLDDIDSIWSVGSNSLEWIAKTFVEDYRTEVASTGYISGNIFSESILVNGDRPPGNEEMVVGFPAWKTVDGNVLGHIECLWNDYRIEGVGILPRPLTDHTIAHCRKGQSERVIVHYMQPHKPYISQYLETGEPLSDAEYNGYKALKRGDVSQEKNWQLYLDNLRSVLDEVELLLENVDAERVVITADHGEAFGEWGAFGHPEGFPAPVVKKVPWVETTAVDDGDYSPTIESRDTEPDADVKEHLADMGYL